MDVETMMLEGSCDDCDYDCAQCHLQGYCQYEKEQEVQNER